MVCGSGRAGLPVHGMGKAGVRVVVDIMRVHRPAAGSALSGGPIGPHFVENVGNTVLHILAVEIKDHAEAGA